jgi:hypothetical protein
MEVLSRHSLGRTEECRECTSLNNKNIEVTSVALVKVVVASTVLTVC